MFTPWCKNAHFLGFLQQFHPDKAHQADDPSLVAEYTATFRLIQQAYEVLSDNHERAW